MIVTGEDDVRQLGAIRIAKGVFDNETLIDMGGFRALFSEFYPIHIHEERFKYDMYYIGISPQFDFIKKGERIPLYNATMTRHCLCQELMILTTVEFTRSTEPLPESFVFVG